MKNTIKREQRQTCPSLPNVSILRDKGAKQVKQIVKITAGALLLIVLLLSCSRSHENIERTLLLAGDNRHEPEKVLSFYDASGDKLKKQAACFMIENMPGRFCNTKRQFGKIQQHPV